MSVNRLGLSRNVLKAVGQGIPEAVRALERLFAVGDRFEPRQILDIDFPIIIRTTGAGIPTMATLLGNIKMPQWQVNDVNDCEAQELVHSWVLMSELQWHIHLTTNGVDASDRWVRFEIEYSYAKVGGAWTAPVTVGAELKIPANTPNRTMLSLEIARFTPSDLNAISGHVIARLKRVAAVGSAPTNNPFVSMLQLHALVDSLGSLTIAGK